MSAASMRACGLCGSDLHLFESGPLVPGVVPGHEIAGELDALAPAAAALDERSGAIKASALPGE